MRTISKTLLILLIFLLVASNITWFTLYCKEHNKLRHAIIPNNANDYFTTQKILTQYQIQTEKFLLNPLGTVAEIRYYPAPLPYNIYFETEESYNEFIKDTKNKKDAPLILQNPDYPNGCESASAVMFLNYFKINITLKEFVENYLKKDDVYEEHGERYGPDPSYYYAGDPASKNRGWGALEPVIDEAISKVITEKDRDFYDDYRHTSLISSNTKKIPLYLLASSEYPSIIWITQDYQVSNEVYEWFSPDKLHTYTYPKNSHTVLLTGMDEDYYYINDPLKEEKNIPVPRKQLEDCFDSMGRQFISVT